MITLQCHITIIHSLKIIFITAFEAIKTAVSGDYMEAIGKLKDAFWSNDEKVISDKYLFCNFSVSNPQISIPLSFLILLILSATALSIPVRQSASHLML